MLSFCILIWKITWEYILSVMKAKLFFCANGTQMRDVHKMRLIFLSQYFLGDTVLKNSIFSFFFFLWKGSVHYMSLRNSDLDKVIKLGQSKRYFSQNHQDLQLHFKSQRKWEIKQILGAWGWELDKMMVWNKEPRKRDRFVWGEGKGVMHSKWKKVDPVVITMTTPPHTRTFRS